MAHKMIVLALILVASIGLVSVESSAEAPKSPSTSSSEASTPTTTTSTSSEASAPVTSTSASTTGANPKDDDDVIGAADGTSGDTAVEAPIGGPVSAEAFGPTADIPTMTPKSGATTITTTIKASAIVVVAAMAVFFF